MIREETLKEWKKLKDNLFKSLTELKDFRIRFKQELATTSNRPIKTLSPEAKLDRVKDLVMTSKYSYLESLIRRGEI